jgi:hypothetical protein
VPGEDGRVGGVGLQARGLRMMAERLDGPDPPRRVTFGCSFGVGMRWRTGAYVTAVERLMAGRPYELVEKAIGTEGELVERGVFKRPRRGPRRDPRARVAHLRYVHRDAGGAGVPARGRS